MRPVFRLKPVGQVKTVRIINARLGLIQRMAHTNGGRAGDKKLNLTFLESAQGIGTMYAGDCAIDHHAIVPE